VAEELNEVDRALRRDDVERQTASWSVGEILEMALTGLADERAGDDDALDDIEGVLRDGINRWPRTPSSARAAPDRRDGRGARACHRSDGGLGRIGRLDPPMVRLAIPNDRPRTRVR
jgi:hypothetical protein